MELLGLPFVVITPSAAGDTPLDETPLPGETPTALVQRLSQIKAQLVATGLPAQRFPEFEDRSQAVVIAADTVVVLADKILGKPNHPAEARQMLQQLRQQHHHVYSGLTIAAVSWEPKHARATITRMVTRLQQSKVWMRPYTATEIEAYLASGDPLDKAGAYGIQNKSFSPVARLEGCFASVMGFPLGELAVGLKEIGIALPSIAPLCTQHTRYPCCQKA